MPQKINLDLAHCTILWGSRNPSLELEPFFFFIFHIIQINLLLWEVGGKRLTMLEVIDCKTMKYCKSNSISTLAWDR